MQKFTKAVKVRLLVPSSFGVTTRSCPVSMVPYAPKKSPEPPASFSMGGDPIARVVPSRYCPESGAPAGTLMVESKVHMGGPAEGSELVMMLTAWMVIPESPNVTIGAMSSEMDMSPMVG